MFGDGGPAGRTIMTPKLVGGVNDRWKEIRPNLLHTLAIDETGHLWAWGSNSSGQLGDGTTTARTVPVPIKPDMTFSSLATTNTGTSSAAIASDGHLYVWGDNTSGQLGTGSVGSFLTTSTLVAPTVTFKSAGISASNGFGIDTDNGAWAWGTNSLYQLADGTQAASNLPKRVAPGKTFTSIDIQPQSAHAIDTAGKLWGWGSAFHGQVGDGSVGAGVVVTAMTAIAPTRTFKSAITPRGSDFVSPLTPQVASGAWGIGPGIDTFAPFQVTGIGDQLLPRQIAPGTTFSAIESDGKSFVARKTDGTFIGWGSNGSYQLGSGPNTALVLPAIAVAPQ